jgi:hypothetical protein
MSSQVLSFVSPETIDVELCEIEPPQDAALLDSITALIVDVEADVGPSNVFLDPRSACALDAFAELGLDCVTLDSALLESIDGDTVVEDAAPERSGQFPALTFDRARDRAGVTVGGEEDDEALPWLEEGIELLEEDAEWIDADEIDAVVDPEPVRLPQFTLTDARAGYAVPAAARQPPRLPTFSLPDWTPPARPCPPVRLARFELPEQDLTWYEVMVARRPAW